MNIHYLGIILHILNGIIILVILLSSPISKKDEKKTEYAKDHRIYYPVNKALIVWRVFFATAGLYFPIICNNSYVNVVFQILFWIGMIFSGIRLRRDESCLVLDGMKVTVKYKSKKREDAVFYISDFEGFSDKKPGNPAKLTFNGNREVDLGFLDESDAREVCRTTKRIYEENALPEHIDKKAYARELTEDIKQYASNAGL